MLVAKYGWHLPLYRQAKMLSTQGIDIDRSTLAFWVGYAAAELAPLYERLKAHLLASRGLRSTRRRCRFSIPVADAPRPAISGPWRATTDPSAETIRPPSPIPMRQAEARCICTTLLKNYRGIVQCDGYAPYKKLPDDAITLAFCWAHVRRGFFEIARKGNAPIATRRSCASRFTDRSDHGAKAPNERRAARKDKSAPHCQALKRFLEKQLGRVSAKAPIARAIRYTLRHWQGLIRFLDDGRIDLDSNIVERSMRPQALTRKNALFAGHDDGAENWAIAASLIETCKLNGIDPYTYLADVLSRLVNLWPNNRLDELLPELGLPRASNSSAMPSTPPCRPISISIWSMDNYATHKGAGKSKPGLPNGVRFITSTSPPLTPPGSIRSSAGSRF